MLDFQFRVSPIEKKLVQAVNLDNFETKTSEQQQTPAKPIKSFFEFIEKITNCNKIHENFHYFPNRARRRG